jgi:chromosome segregation ATPase
MGRSKSPVDELVDGIDAIGSILDENLPEIKSRLEELDKNHMADINEVRRSMKESEETYADLKRAVTNLDIRIEEILGTIGALGRRMDQLQKSLLDLTLAVEKVSVEKGPVELASVDNELSDTVKVLEDRLKKLESGRRPDFPKRF